MDEAMKQGLPWLPRSHAIPKRDERLSIVGYGPSLLDTWQDIKHPMITTSGAHNFLIERGVIPDYHADMDPREHKLDFIRNSRENVTYIMASQCPPETWTILKDRKVLLWHAWSSEYTDRWVAANDPGAQINLAGTAIGLGAITVGSRLGFCKYDCHGFDCSKANNERHAGPHGGLKWGHEDLLWCVEDRIFVTTRIMVNTAFEFIGWVKQYDLDIRLHGDGMLQYMVETGSVGLPVSAMLDSVVLRSTA